MQWAPSLLLLLGAVAVEPLSCHRRVRNATTLNGLQNASWIGSGNASEKQETCQGNWTACARWLTNFGHEWEDYYGGCNTERYAKYYETTQLVQKYCADRNDTNCTSTQFFTFYTLEHKPTHLCCCFDDMCNATFPKQLALTTSTQKPPTGQKQSFTCEASMRNATTPDGLLNATAVDKHDETCEAAWAPCVEFVYKNEADGLWRRWRAGCSYNYSSVNYTDIVKQFCTASDLCKQFDMIEPSTRDIGKHNHFVYTQAYACCCSGSGCDMPDTVGCAQAFAQTAPTPPPPPQTAPPPPSMVTTSGGPPTTSLDEMECSVGEGVCGPRVCYRLYRKQKLKEFGCIAKLTAVPQQMVTAVCAAQAEDYCFMTTDKGEQLIRLCCCSKHHCNRGRVIGE